MVNRLFRSRGPKNEKNESAFDYYKINTQSCILISPGLFRLWGVKEPVQCRLSFSLFQDFPEVINGIVVVEFPNPIELSVVWVPFFFFY
jgi:hypothetical protein